MKNVDCECQFNQAQQLLRVTARGFWTEATVERLNTEMRSVLAINAACPHPERLVILVDLREQDVLPASAATAIPQIIEAPAKVCRRFAVLYGGALNRLQINRIVKFENKQLFTEEQEAMDWLFAPDPRP